MHLINIFIIDDAFNKVGRLNLDKLFELTNRLNPRAWPF